MIRWRLSKAVFVRFTAVVVIISLLFSNFDFFRGGLFTNEVTQAIISTGMNASDLLGQLNGDLTVNWTGLGRDNGAGAANDKGFSWNRGVALDSVGHRLFVSDGDNHRVLVFNLDVNNQPIDPVADYVLGQTDFVTSTSGTTQAKFNGTRGLDYDDQRERLFVADSSNRVMVFDLSAGITNGMNAANVLGQPNFTTSTIGLTQATFWLPEGVEFDDQNNRLFVAARGDHRVMVFDLSAGITNGMNAANVFGQTDFVTRTSSANQSKFWGPNEIEFDDQNNRLFVTDTSQHRVMVFDLSAGITNGMNAANVLGKTNFTDGSWVSAATQANFKYPEGVDFDAQNNRLFVTDAQNYRVMVFDLSAGITNGMNAANVLGQTNFTTRTTGTTQAKFIYPSGLEFDAQDNRLFVSDKNNHRVMMFEVEPEPPPSATINSVAQKTDGSGKVDISLTLDAYDADDILSAKVLFAAGADCSAAAGDPTIDTTGGTYSSTYGSPTINNVAEYQISNVTVSSGANTIQVDWLGATDLPAANGTYCVKIIPYDGVDEGTAVTTSFTLDNTSPTGLTALSATGHTTSSMSLSWSQVTETNFDHYEVWYGAVQADVENRTGTATEWDNTDDGALATITTTSTTITSLNPNTANYYKIWAVDGYGNTENKPVDPVLVYNSAAAPLAPTVTATATDALSVIVAVNANPSNTEFAIQVTGGGYVQADGTFGVAEDWQTYTEWGGAVGQTISDLTMIPNTQYEISVKARNGDSDETAFSSSTSKYTLAEAVTGVVLTNVTDKDSYKLSLTWNDDGNSYTGMKIDLSSFGPCDEIFDIGEYNNTSVIPAKNREISASGNTCYKARILSYNADGVLNSTDTAISNELTTPPLQPSNLSKSLATDEAITWQWDELFGATNYKIYRTSDDTFIGETGNAIEVYEQTTSDGVTSLVANSQYTVYVRAENANGEGIASSNASAYTDANAPANLSQDANFRTVDTLRWVWESGGFQKDFYAWMDSPAANSGYIIGLLWGVEGTLSTNTLYTAYVKARNDEDAETTSVSAQAYTAQISPSSINFGAVEVDSIELVAVGAFANLDQGSSGIHFINTTTAADNTFQTTSWINTSLNPNTEYSYTVSALNGDSVETASVTDVKYTLANAPGAPLLTNASGTTLDVTINTNLNPATTKFAIYETTTEQYVQADGTLGAEVVWLVAGIEGWGAVLEVEGKVRVNGLIPNTNYEFSSKAKNEEEVETDLSIAQSLYTLVEELSGPVLSSPTTGSLDLLIAQGANPEDTEYKIFESVLEKYVQADGTLANDPIYQTAVEWGAVAAVDGQITINGLDNNTEYTFVVTARNADGVESSASDSALLYTLAAEPTSLTGTIDENSGAALIWVGDNPEMTEYFVSRVDDEAINSGWITTLSWTDSLATDFGTEYCYLVKARNGNEIETSSASLDACLIIPVVVTTQGGGGNYCESICNRKST